MTGAHLGGWLANAADALGPWLLAATLAVPLVFLAACLFENIRRLALAFQWLCPIPALLAAILAIVGGPFAFDAPALRISLRLDLPGALLLAAASLLWIIVSAADFSGGRGRRNDRFAVCWLLTLTGSVGVFIAADVLTFYLVYALVSIPAYGLIADDDEASSKRAGGVYMAFTILGEAVLLLAFALLAAGEPSGSLRIDDVVKALPASPWRDGALALLIAGFGIKMALAPLNGWMPLAYTVAPIPAAVVLSGAAVKAGVIGLIRFLPLAEPLPGWGQALAVIGFFSAFYGVALGITQRNPKTVLAYSSISQMGVIAATIGMALASGYVDAVAQVAFYAANHVLVKGALFLAVGVAAATDFRRDRLPLILAAVLALSLAGLPFTGGALAKMAVKGPLGDGVAASLANISAAASALLMLHFLTCLMRMDSREGQATAPASVVRFWPAIAIGAVVAPWLLYPAVGDPLDAVTFAKVWEGLWPLLIGAALALGLRRWGNKLPRIPAGDTVVVAEAGFHASFALSGLFESIDVRLRQWPVASLALVAIALTLAAMAAYGG
jgi:formate hydrogenlyase subunit 3/multisubunit Na+/H+ antiporter MnhD subunit